MTPAFPVEILTLHLGANDRWQGRPLFEEIVDRCRGAAVEQVLVQRGISGYGASSVIHRHHFFGRSGDDPIAVTVVARPEVADALLPHLSQIIGGGLITRDRSEARRYSGEAAC